MCVNNERIHSKFSADVLGENPTPETVLLSTSPSTGNVIVCAKLIFNSLANDIKNHRECNISILGLKIVQFFESI